MQPKKCTHKIADFERMHCLQSYWLFDRIARSNPWWSRLRRVGNEVRETYNQKLESLEFCTTCAKWKETQP